MKIKICGTRRIEDALFYARLGIDYAGFIFAKSPRQVTKEQAREIIAHLGSVKPVGVFVNESEDVIAETARFCGLEVIQLHGDEDADFARRIKDKTGLEVWKAVHMKDSAPSGFISSYPADGFLLDTYSAAYGGSGKRFDWSLLSGLSGEKVILAGGLSPENAAEAAATGVFALDFNSGLETDGFKDEKKATEAVEKIRNYELGMRNAE